ncbi:DUF7521 family protein [Haloglomus litoreum]|uniref:DUF7521 family protein n=1 Tax=Haloglomus litoreum TaxID=3034026 RepID=UPI0023E8CCD4|nr:hypothetical protein [Haloglomus sp. DT116]
MVDVPTLVLSAIRFAVFLLGAGVSWVSYKAYRRTGERFLRNATVGFAIITVGVFIEGVLFNFFSLDLTTVHIIESLAIGIGLLVLHLSLRP